MKKKILGIMGVMMLFVVAISFAGTTYTHTETSEPESSQCDFTGVTLTCEEPVCSQIWLCTTTGENYRITDNWQDKKVSMLKDKTYSEKQLEEREVNELTMENKTISIENLQVLSETLEYDNNQKKKRTYLEFKNFNVFGSIIGSQLTVQMLKNNVVLFYDNNIYNSSTEFNEQSFLTIGELNYFEETHTLRSMMDDDMQTLNKIMEKAKLNKQKIPYKQIETYIDLMHVKYFAYIQAQKLKVGG